MFLSVRELGKRGANYELPPYELDPNEFTRVNNVRFWDGTASRHPDPDVVVQEDLAWVFGGSPIWFEAWLNKEGEQKYVVARETDLRLWNPVTPTWGDATNSTDFPSGYTSSRDWNSVVFGDTAVFNNGQDDPQMLEDGDTEFSKLTAWPANTKCNLIRKFKNYLIALGITESSTYIPNKVLWSDRAVTNSVPQSWDKTDDTVQAGDQVFAADDAEIMDGLELGDVFIIYTKRAIYEMSLIGAPDVMSFRKISDNSLLGKHCVAAFDNFHICVGEREIYIHDGQAIRHIANQRVRNTFFDELVNKDSVRVEVSPITKEVFIAYNNSTSDNTAPANRALVWSYEYDTFSFVDMPRVTCLKFGYFPGTVTTWAELQTAGTKWSELNQTWSQFSSEDLLPTVFMTVDNDEEDTGTHTGANNASVLTDSSANWTTGELVNSYVFNDTDGSFGLITANTSNTITGALFFGTDNDWDTGDAYRVVFIGIKYLDLLFSSTSTSQVLLERTSIDMDRLLTRPTHTVKLIKEVLPQIEGSGDVTFQLGCQDAPGEAVTWLTNQTYTIGDDYYVDLFACGRYLSWRLQAGAGVKFRMTGMDIDVEEVGRR